MQANQATRSWYVTFSRGESGIEPSLMPDHLTLEGNEVRMIRGSGLHREIMLQIPVKELPPESIQVGKWQSSPHPDGPMRVVQTKPTTEFDSMLG